MDLSTLMQLPDGEIGGYQRGSTSSDTAAVLVLQEIFGVNTNIRSTVDWLAERGFYAVAPDLFWRQSAGIDLNPDEPESRPLALKHAEAYAANAEHAFDDILRIIQWLRGRHSKVGVLGYCLGGRMSLQCWLDAEVDAAAVYYGVGMAPQLSGNAEFSDTPLLMHLGAADPLNPPFVQGQIIQRLNKAANATVVVHEGVGHAFARRGASSYVADVAEAADISTLAFLEKYLT